MFCRVFGADLCGIEPRIISVEADISDGLPAFNMVGLPSSEVKEAKERVCRAIVNSGIEIPPKKIVINLSPAYIRKSGAGLDLPIAMAMLGAMERLDKEKVEDTMFIGELGLDGSIGYVRGVLPMAMAARDNNLKKLIIPSDNAFEGRYVSGITIYGADSLAGLVDGIAANSLRFIDKTDVASMLKEHISKGGPDFDDVKGQDAAKRATMIAVAGFHNLLYIGPPGSGKSLMASRIPTVLNPMSVDECLEVSKIYSAAGYLKHDTLIFDRPFRAPHHTITPQALVGGSSNPRPGEVTLAHRGVLFLDEAPEFQNRTIETLRQPLENKEIMINRVNYRARFPADFMLVMAMNPCKCGYYPDRKYCMCKESDVRKYVEKIKGPVLDRIDICISVPKITIGDIEGSAPSISSKYIKEGIRRAHCKQAERFEGTGINFNSEMKNKQIEMYCVLEPEVKALLDKAYDKYNMSARGYYKVLKVARTIADIDGAEIIEKKHLLEALGYRNNLII